MSKIDKNFVKKSFNSSACTYDKHAGLQKRMIEHLLMLLEPEYDAATKVLDIGMGTGNLTLKLQEKFPGVKLYGCDLAVKMVLCAMEKFPHSRDSSFFLTSDAEFLPYKDCSFDLVASSFTYQWLEQWDRALKEVLRVLKPGGTFIFSAFGKKTFHELRESYKKACLYVDYQQGEALDLAITAEKIDKTLSSCGFTESLTQSCLTVETYESINDLFKSIKGMGARNASQHRNKTFAIRKVWKKMVEIYENDFAVLGKIPATFEIITGRGLKK